MITNTLYIPSFTGGNPCSPSATQLSVEAGILFIIQAGTAPDTVRKQHGDLPQWFVHALQRSPSTVRVVRAFEGEALPSPTRTTIAVITGSWSMVTDRHPWSEELAGWIRAAVDADASLFGVCYGHQLMAHALGGRVDYHPRGRELGCRTIRMHAGASEDELLNILPGSFPVHLTHEQSVLDLPRQAKTLAWSEHDPHQIIRYAPNAISTQFHPEFTPSIARSCIERRRQALVDEGNDPDALIRDLIDTPVPVTLLCRFVEEAQRKLLHQGAL